MKFFLLLILLLVSFLHCFSQRNISGTVKMYDTGELVKDLKVSVKGSSSFAISNEKGKYELIIPDSIKTIEFTNFGNLFVKEVQFLDVNKIDILLSNIEIDIFELTLEEPK